MSGKTRALAVAMALCMPACGGEDGPRIVSIYPQDGAGGVPLDAAVQVAFDRRVRFASDAPPLALSLDGEPVPGEVAIGEGGGPLVFTPHRLLLAGRSYRASLERGIEDLRGQPLEKELSWHFSTLPACEMRSTPDAELPVGPDGKGGWVIPGGRRISPVGIQLDLGSFPTNLLLSADSSTLVVTNNGHGYGPDRYQSLSVVDLAAPQVVQSVDRSPPLGFFYGLVVSGDGSRLFAAGGAAERVEVFDVQADGRLREERVIELDGFPAGMALDEGRGLLFVAAQTANELKAVDCASGEHRWSTRLMTLPYDVLLGPGGARLYVSLWGRADLGEPGLVAVLDPDSGAVLARVEVGKNPEDLLLAEDGRLFVACSDADRVDVIDTSSDALVASWPLRRQPDEPVGLSPVGLALDERRQRLYVACAQKNSIDVLSLADGAILGSIPTGWYPTAVHASRDGQHLYIVNAKGRGLGPNLDRTWIHTRMQGSLTIAPVPSDRELAGYVGVIHANNTYPLGFYPDRCLGKAFPLPRALGEPSPIKHVVFVLRENKTYDQNLGDLEGTDGDPALVMFGEDVTPNLHKLAREFCNLDNYHCSNEVSVQGHYWSVATTINDFSEKSWHSWSRSTGQVPGIGIRQVDYPAGAFIWQKLDQAGIDFRDYGQAVGIGGEFDRFADRVNLDYVLDYGMNLYDTPDATRVGWFMEEVEAGIFPPFVYLLLPNDHTFGSTPGKPTPQYLIAENDYATGLLVDRLSHSPYWPETLIIIVEDDPQSGADHVDNYRSIALLVSPYTRKGYTSSVHYGLPSLVRTYGLILGMPALNLLDETAVPVYDCFSASPDYTPYELRELSVPFELNALHGPGAQASLQMDFSAPDRAAGLGGVLWQVTHPGEPLPPGLEDRDPDADPEEPWILPVPLMRDWPAAF
ncbi:MAG: Ig-like domain-containing protein [Deltaproteobacteria bacterium]|nr:Ig-like domain-containing protein [Deltaproteobacteria bacterium]